MRTTGFVLASLICSSVAFAEDLQPLTEPASPEVNDATYANTRFGAGIAVVGASYLASVAYALSSDHQNADQLYIPIAGPWLALDHWGTATGGEKTMLIADGVVQAAGAVLLLDGLVDPDLKVQKPVVADTSLHLAPTGTGMAVWSNF